MTALSMGTIASSSSFSSSMTPVSSSRPYRSRRSPEKDFSLSEESVRFYKSDQPIFCSVCLRYFAEKTAGSLHRDSNSDHRKERPI